MLNYSPEIFYILERGVDQQQRPAFNHRKLRFLRLHWRSDLRRPPDSELRRWLSESLERERMEHAGKPRRDLTVAVVLLRSSIRGVRLRSGVDGKRHRRGNGS